jgi:acetolactate synthase-1/2/3 large subunit
MVIAFCGDGDFLMTGQELATAIREHLSVIVLLFNNNMYGTIRMHQENEYPERISATELTNPDFVQLARAYGAYGERIDRTEDFAAAFERAAAAERPAILEITLDQEVIAPTATITSIRNKSRR